MIKLTVLDRDDTEQEIEIPTDINLNLMEVLKASDYHVLATCGGMALCATCHVQILEGLEQLAEAQDAELDMLDTLPDAGDKKFPKVIIIGGGFGGIQLAKKLRHAEVNILMLDRHNYHTFQPLLYQVATGGLEPDSIAFPIRKVFRKQKNLAFRVANVTAIHTENNTISTSIGDFDYDYLVLATGSETNFFGQKDKI